MKINESTGLVPVKVKDAGKFLTRLEGEVFGLPPEKAAELIEAGMVEAFDPEATAPSGGEVDIPADWASAHHKTRIALANKLLGEQAKVETAEEADAVIAAEVAKRAA